MYRNTRNTVLFYIRIEFSHFDCQASLTQCPVDCKRELDRLYKLMVEVGVVTSEAVVWVT